jgi:ElaA protein
MEWEIKKFEELSNRELYSVLQLRAEVFVVEQNCPYLDLDDKDVQSLHVMGKMNNEILAYSRIVFPGISYDTPAIGRVVTSKKIRGSGAGKMLMQKSIEFCQQHFPGQKITISAQCYLEKFYSELGFNTISDTYLEDDIPHVKMKMG